MVVACGAVPFAVEGMVVALMQTWPSLKKSAGTLLRAEKLLDPRDVTLTDAMARLKACARWFCSLAP
jgi:hypothetical protein